MHTKPWAVIALFSMLLSIIWPRTPIASAGNVKKSTAETSVSKKTKKGEDMKNPDKLTEEQGDFLLSVARKTIKENLFKENSSEDAKGDLGEIFDEKRGTFVTLTKDGSLRGCIGHIIPQESLLEGVRVNAINAAFRDPRFPPLSSEEWEKIHIEVSILTTPEPLSYSGAEDLLDKIRPGVDGLIIRRGNNQATFLPQVWDQLPSKEEFLNHLCYKAGLASGAWRDGDLQVSTYQVQAFEE